MIKKDITFVNYNDTTVTKSYYFNYTKLEAAEIELEHGDLEDTIQMLNETEDAKKAYNLFKEIVINGVGVKSADGNEFDKSEDVRRRFINSPAMAVLIWGFIEDPESAGPFLEGMLPAQDIAEGRARLERKKLEEALAAQNTPKDHIQAPVAPVVVPEPARAPRTDDEILAAEVGDLTNEELARLVELRRAAASA